MPKLMDRVDWMKTVADVGSAEGVWCENISGDSDTVSFSLPESGRYRIILVKLEEVHRPNVASRTSRNRQISPKVRALRGAAKVKDGRDYKDILAEALVEKYEALG
jgi:hypothetical protein